jgi:hypothetical protein
MAEYFLQARVSKAQTRAFHLIGRLPGEATFVVREQATPILDPRAFLLQFVKA